MPNMYALFPITFGPPAYNNIYNNNKGNVMNNNMIMTSENIGKA